MKVGVVGLGIMGQHHVRVYSELGCKIAGVVDVDGVRARQIAEKYGTNSYTDYKDLLGQVDAVSLAVPTGLHAAVACEFLNRGIHCLVEKPIATNASEALLMAESADKNRCKLMVGHIERFNPAVLKLKEMIEQGLLGRLVIISVRRVGPFVARMRDVGIILDSAIHDIDIIRFLMNRDPAYIYSNTVDTGTGTKDNALIVLDFEDALASLEVNWLSPVKVRTLVATGSMATCQLDYIKQELHFFTQTESKQVEVCKSEPLKIEIKHFLDCIERNLSPMVDSKAAIKALEIAAIAGENNGRKVRYAADDAA